MEKTYELGLLSSFRKRKRKKETCLKVIQASLKMNVKIKMEEHSKMHNKNNTVAPISLIYFEIYKVQSDI